MYETFAKIHFNNTMDPITRKQTFAKVDSRYLIKYALTLKDETEQFDSYLVTVKSLKKVLFYASLPNSQEGNVFLKS